LGFLATDTAAYAVAWLGTTALVGTSAGLLAVDVTSPAVPVGLDLLATDAGVTAIVVQGSVAYVGTQDGLRIVEAAEPAALRETGWCEAVGNVYGLAVQDRLIGLAAGGWGFVSVRYNPLIEVFPGDTDNDGKVDAFDILPLGVWFGQAGPARASAATAWQAQEAGQWPSAAATHADANGDGVVDERDLFPVGLNWGQLHAGGGDAFAIDPQAPELREEHGEDFRALLAGLTGDGPAVAAMRALVADVLGVGSPPPVRLLLAQNSPNPFNPRTQITFSLPAGTPVTLKVVDLRGRVVDVPIDRLVHARGVHTFVYEPRDLPSGVYILRLETGMGTVSRKATLLK
jgi:hypothetical protein